MNQFKDKKIEYILYNKEELRQIKINSLLDSVATAEKKYINWFLVPDQINEDHISQLKTIMDLPDGFTQEYLNDISENQFEEFADCLFLSWPLPFFNKGFVETKSILLIFHKNSLYSFGLDEEIFKSIFNKLRFPKSRLRQKQCDFLLYSVLDNLMEIYFDLLEKMDKGLETIEALVEEDDKWIPEKVLLSKRNLLEIQKSFWPLKNAVRSISKEPYLNIQTKTLAYFKRLSEYSQQVLELNKALREILTGFLDSYRTNLANKMNKIMQVLTLIATIFIPLTFIAGIYGMNFKFMPELDIPWAYFVVLGFMGLVAIGMIIYFKIKKWF